MALEGFHPAVASWFEGRYSAPTEPQRLGWPAIQAGSNTLIAAPTGSGKTLAAFLAAVDDLVKQSQQGAGLPTGIQILYVSPLKALSADIERNLQEPLTGIEAELQSRGLAKAGIRVVLRTGDTPAAVRAAMIRKPPHILVTTPETLYILLTSQRGREVLGGVRTVIVDEIHAMVGNKRGAHLALSLERLEALTEHPLVRVGLSATQKPIAAVAAYLTGTWRSGINGSHSDGSGLNGGSLGGGSPDGGSGESRSAEVEPSPAPCTVVDTGHARLRDLAIEVPDSPLEAVMSGEVWTEVYNRLADLIEQHKTTLVFVNTRRLAERVARHLSERLGEEHVTAHHGSMARDQRLDAEQRLKAGKLRALVATASLELGIDVGAVELVCQVGATKSIAALLQRVGRSGHNLQAVPKGRIFPLTRDELAECAALLWAVQEGDLDQLILHENPLDIVAQHVVAEAACEDWDADELYALTRRAWPFRDLARTAFDQVVDMLARGYKSGRGRHGAYIYHDVVNGRIKGRKGARMAAIVSGGAIPDVADYDVVLDPEGVRLGSVNEDFAIESLPGDIFQLGNTSWRILRIEPGKVRVEDAAGQPPSIPFWLGEAPSRTDELSGYVSRMREEVGRLLEETGADLSTEPLLAEPEPVRPALLSRPLTEPQGELLRAATDLESASLRQGASPVSKGADATDSDRMDSDRMDSGGMESRGMDSAAVPRTRMLPDGHPVLAWFAGIRGLPPEAAQQLGEYLATAHAVLGVLPTQHTLVLERFFDEGGGMQLIVHAPFGSRLNRAWGLSLRKRFCRSFNFELQAAATEDAIVLSLGPTHSFPLEDAFRFLHSNSVGKVLEQALLDAPMFTVRWRHNANRALAVLRRMGSRKVPAQIQRMRADDLLALVFPDQQACLENIVGDREIPDHPLVVQTLRDCTEEAMDLAGLERLMRSMEGGERTLVCRDLSHPSPLAEEILNARPYAFLDDAPLEERRTRAVQTRRWLDPETAASLAALDAEAIARVREEAWPQPANADDLHDALLQLGLLTAAEARQAESLPAHSIQGALLPPVTGWRRWLEALAKDGRAAELEVPDFAAPDSAGPDGEARRYWVAAEWMPALRALYPQATLHPPLDLSATLPPAMALREWSAAEAAVELLRARLEACGPVSVAQLAHTFVLTVRQVEAALLALEGEGFALRGRFTPGCAEEEWCERGLLARIHRYTLNRLRREVEPVSEADFMRYLFAWQRVTPGRRAEGVEGVAGVIEQLEGFAAPAAAWEGELLPTRLRDYDPQWLDTLCAMGRVVWVRRGNGPVAQQGASGSLARGAKTRAGRNGRGTGRPASSAGVLADLEPRRRRAGPVATTPIALLGRGNVPWWRQLDGSTGAVPTLLSAQARSVRDLLQRRGASFFSEIAEGAGLLPTHLEAALAELVACGQVTADGFSGLRALLRPARKRPSVRRLSLTGAHPAEGAGRWALVSRPPDEAPAMEGVDAGPVTGGVAGANAAPSPAEAQVRREAGEAFARVLLRRYGVVFRRVVEREPFAPPWRELLRVLRRLEARGEIRGGRFVSGVSGEQYALPEAVGTLRDLRKQAKTGALVSVSGADPLNLVGVLLPGRRLPALTANRVLYREGLPVALLEGGEVHYLPGVTADEQWVLRNALLGHPGNLALLPVLPRA